MWIGYQVVASYEDDEFERFPICFGSLLYEYTAGLTGPEVSLSRNHNYM
jgi:hypothetical protein